MKVADQNPTAPARELDALARDARGVAHRKLVDRLRRHGAY
jgi:hypothetical protein